MQLIRPIISEKSLLQASHGWYTFAFSVDARKEAIGKAIEDGYKVNVLEVRTRTMHGKEHRVGRKMMKVRKADWKKAMVKLKAGQHIDVFESVMQQINPSASAKATADKAVKKEAKVESKKVAETKRLGDKETKRETKKKS